MARKEMTRIINQVKVTCDFCGSEKGSLSQCDICKKDFCEEHGHLMVTLIGKTQGCFGVCNECYEKLRKGSPNE